MPHYQVSHIAARELILGPSLQFLFIYSNNLSFHNYHRLLIGWIVFHSLCCYWENLSFLMHIVIVDWNRTPDLKLAAFLEFYAESNFANTVIWASSFDMISVLH